LETYFSSDRSMESNGAKMSAEDADIVASAIQTRPGVAACWLRMRSKTS
jgi:hypothetical protein